MKRALLPLVMALIVAMPASAHAASAATITSCKGDRMTVAGKVSVTGKTRSRVRGAVLQMRFRAMPLFGLPKTGAWTSKGKKSSASGQQEFSGLPADNWAGVLGWRFKRGSRTVLSGIERSQPVRVGRAKGRANCTLPEGLKPTDSIAPTLFINFADGLWHKAPAAVQLRATDDFSGVKAVSYSLDGGAVTPLRNGGSFDVAAEGTHTVAWSATDVAGNTATRTDTVLVDAAPPTKPALSRPFSVTASTTPTFQWSASTDSGSGIKSYVVAVKKADGSLAALLTADGAATSIQSRVALNNDETYTATVTAVDKAEPAWTTESDPVAFRVDTQPDSAATPATGTIISGSAKSSMVFTIALDRPADQATVTTSTALLQGVDPSGDVPAAVSCNAGCTTITVDPNGALGEGRYQIAFNGLKSQEGVFFPQPDARYAVPFQESGSVSATSPPVACMGSGSSTPTAPIPLDAAIPGETATLDFDITNYSGSGGWSMQAFYNNVAIGTALEGVGPGHYKLTFPIGGHTGSTLNFRLTAHCSNTSVTADNLFGSRVP